MAKIEDARFSVEQYQTARPLETRINLHAKYSVNPQGFASWIFSHYAFLPGEKILETGCGTGAMWAGFLPQLPAGCTLTLTDLSQGMLSEAKKNLAGEGDIRFELADIQRLPYPDHAFDAVIANMMLYHVPDIHQALREVGRVLRPGGSFYCATYGENGILSYLAGLLRDFGVKDPLNRRFTLQSGKEFLLQHFSSVERDDYPDALRVTQVEDLADYLYSLGTMANLDPSLRQPIIQRLQENMRDGALTVPKEYGMFICENQKL